MVWAVGKARCRWPRHLGTIKAGCQGTLKSTCHTVGLVPWRRKAEDVIPVIRKPVLSLEQKTSAKR